MKRKKRSDIDHSLSNADPVIHQGISPAEIYPSDNVRVEWTDPDNKLAALNMRPYRISPLGMELLVTDPASTKALLDRTKSFGLKVYVGNQVSQFNAISVKTLRQDKGRTLIGIRWCDPVVPVDEGSADRRGNQRWLCGEDFLPSGVAPNPARFNDFVYFRVLDISSKGMLLLTSFRNRVLIPGMTLRGAISFPLCAQIDLDFRIKNTRIVTLKDTEYLGLGVELIAPPQYSLQAMAQYLFQFGPKSSIEDLKRSGLGVPNASAALDLHYVRSEEDYKEVLELRLRTYRLAGKLDNTATLDTVSDIYDARSRILTARYRGQLIATCRVLFHTSEDPYEFEEFSGAPNSFPKQHETVEVSRLCIDPAFRGSDIFYNVFRQILLLTAQAGRRYITAFACDDILNQYLRAGAKRTGVRFAHQGLNGKVHEIIYWDLANVFVGRGINPIVWNFLYSDAIAFLERNSVIPFDRFSSLRIGLYRLAKPLTPFFLGRIRKKSSKKKAIEAPVKAAETEVELKKAA